MAKSGAERTKAWRDRKRISEKKDKKQKKSRAEIKRDSRKRCKIRANLLLMSAMDILNDHENQTSTSTMVHPINDSELHANDNLQYSDLNKFKSARNTFKKDFVNNEFNSVCCVCNKLLFKSDLKPLSVQNKEIIQQKFPEFNGQKDFVCNCCCQSLTRSSVPTLMFNGAVRKKKGLTDEEITCMPEEILSNRESVVNNSSDDDPDYVEEHQCSSIEKPESGARRPSRRAAQLAVQKIHNTVRQFGMTENAIEEQGPPVPLPPQVKVELKQQRVRSILKVISEKTKDTKEWHAIRSPVPDIDLMMECHEELLSAVQVETILKAQMEYNTVMKRLWDLKASNVKITCINNDDETLQSPIPTSPAPKVANIVTLSSETSKIVNLITVVPLNLVTGQLQSN